MAPLCTQIFEELVVQRSRTKHIVVSEALKDSPLVMPAAGLKQPTPVLPMPMYASGTKPACNSSHLLRVHNQY